MRISISAASIFWISGILFGALTICLMLVAFFFCIGILEIVHPWVFPPFLRVWVCNFLPVLRFPVPCGVCRSMALVRHIPFRLFHPIPCCLPPSGMHLSCLHKRQYALALASMRSHWVSLVSFIPYGLHHLHIRIPCSIGFWSVSRPHPFRYASLNKSP